MVFRFQSGIFVSLLTGFALVLGTEPARAAPAASAGADVKAPQEKPLYHRLGGKPVIQKCAREFLDKIRADSRLMKNTALKAVAEGIQQKKLIQEIVDRVCAVSGGPCSMRAGLIERLGPKIRLSPLEWVSVFSVLNQTLTENRVPRREQAEFVALVMKKSKSK